MITRTRASKRNRERLHSAVLRHYEFAMAQYLRDCAKRQTLAMTKEFALRLAKNRSTFSRTITKVTGKQLLKTMRRRQLESAERLLRTSDLEIGEIAIRCAFGRVQSTFARAFRAEFGVAPREYRRRLKSGNR